MLTLEDREQMTDLDVFWYATRFLFKQGQRCYNSKGCRYYHGDLRCAVGCFILNDEYNESMEGAGVGGLIDAHYTPTALRVFLEKHKYILGKLQEFHDVEFHWSSSTSMRRALCSIVLKGIDLDKLYELEFKRNNG